MRHIHTHSCLNIHAIRHRWLWRPIIVCASTQMPSSNQTASLPPMHSANGANGIVLELPPQQKSLERTHNGPCRRKRVRARAHTHTQFQTLTLTCAYVPGPSVHSLPCNGKPPGFVGIDPRAHFQTLGPPLSGC